MKRSPLFALAAATLLLGSLPALSQSIDFGRIKSPEDGFRRYWGLSDEEVKTYRNYMEIAGKYRHEQTSPLLVLSMLADTPEDKEYYARKAARYEQDMVKREIEAAWMMSQAMSADDLSNDMQRFTDGISGINTTDFVPLQESKAREREWREGDSLVLWLDEGCLSTACLDGFAAVIDSLPEGIGVNAVIRSGKMPSEDTAFAGLKAKSPQLQIRPFDAIEHAALAELAPNRAVHMRGSNIVRIVGTASPDTVQSNAGDNSATTGE